MLSALNEAPSWLNSGDTAWQLTSATLVGIMSIPGLAILSYRSDGFPPPEPQLLSDSCWEPQDSGLNDCLADSCGD